MNKEDLKKLLTGVANGDTSVSDAILAIKKEPFEDLGFSKPDIHRGFRQGVPEVIYGDGKTAEQIENIARTLLSGGQGFVLITRLAPEKAEAIDKALPFQYDETARIGIIGQTPSPDTDSEIIIASGGTSDIPVAEEAAVTAEALGNRVKRIYDVGVSGIHRLLSFSDEIMTAKVIVAVAGMEGALPSVIAGIADCPVIAVPTSVGYGASFGGVTALLAMLNSCAAGVSVVNIDNGFGAGYLASMINKIGV